MSWSTYCGCFTLCKPGSDLDNEALERATSVYLVDRVVPMLPEILSNGVCSLRPKEEKYTFSAVFHLNRKGKIKDEWFGKTLIYSDHRFAYEEVQDIIETKQALVSDKHALNGKRYRVDDTTLNAILILDEIAKNLRVDRMKKGAISFDRVEVKFYLKCDKKTESLIFNY